MATDAAGEQERLIAGAQALGVALQASDAQRMSRLLDELAHWNRAYNLTSIRTREAMLTRHVLDSLAAVPFLHGACIADAGTGAGFPGLPLAIVCPERHFQLIDASDKKLGFVRHAARVLGLSNVTALHARLESLSRSQVPADTVVARALAPLDRLLTQVEPLVDTASRVLAMKAQLSAAELSGVGGAWRIEAVHAVQVPGLEQMRNVVIVRRS